MFGSGEKNNGRTASAQTDRKGTLRKGANEDAADAVGAEGSKAEGNDRHRKNCVSEEALKKLAGIAKRLDLPDDVEESAKKIYRECQLKSIITGRRTANFVLSAVIRISCLQASVPRTVEEISAASCVDKEDIERTCRDVLYLLGIKMPAGDTSRYVERCAVVLGCDESLKNIAMQIIEEAVRQGAIKDRPDRYGTAAAAIYAAADMLGEGLSKRHIACASGLSASTIGNRYNELADAAKIVRKRHEGAGACDGQEAEEPLGRNIGALLRELDADLALAKKACQDIPEAEIPLCEVVKEVMPKICKVLRKEDAPSDA